MTRENLNRIATWAWRGKRRRAAVSKVDKMGALSALSSRYASDCDRDDALLVLFQTLVPPLKRAARDQVEFTSRALSSSSAEKRLHCKTLHARDGVLWGCSGVAVRAAALHSYGWNRGCAPKIKDGRAHYTRDGVLIADYEGVVPNYQQIMESYLRTEHTERDELTASILPNGTLLVGVHGCRVLWAELEQALRDLDVSHVFGVANNDGLLIVSNDKDAMCFLAKVRESDNLE